MSPALSLITLSLAILTHTLSHPIDQFSSGTNLKTERSWLWGWAWGAENKVSIVDRSPALSFASRPAAFGAELKEPLLGYVIPLSSFTAPCSDTISFAEPPPNLGCPRLCIHGPNEPEHGDTWIALIQRGECEFVSKVREAQRLGANAVVVGGDNPDTSGNPDMLVNMYSPGDSSDVKIASTFIIYSDYIQLSSLISSSNTSHSGLRTLSLLITAEYSAWEWYSPIVTFIIILLLPSSLTFITLLVHRIRASRAAQRDRAPEDFVNNLPSRVWTGKAFEKLDSQELGSVIPSNAEAPTEEIEEDPSTSQAGKPHSENPWFEQQVECAICLSEFMKGDRVRVLPCQHIFHLGEVDEWLIQRKKLCPVCKADVTQPLQPTPANADATQLHEPQSSPPSSPPSHATERTPLLGDSTVS